MDTFEVESESTADNGAVSIPLLTSHVTIELYIVHQRDSRALTIQIIVFHLRSTDFVLTLAMLSSIEDQGYRLTQRQG